MGGPVRMVLWSKAQRGAQETHASVPLVIRATEVSGMLYFLLVSRRKGNMFLEHFLSAGCCAKGVLSPCVVQAEKTGAAVTELNEQLKGSEGQQRVHQAERFPGVHTPSSSKFSGREAVPLPALAPPCKVQLSVSCCRCPPGGRLSSPSSNFCESQ